MKDKNRLMTDGCACAHCAMPSVAGQAKATAEGIEEGLTIRDCDERKPSSRESCVVSPYKLVRLGAGAVLLALAMVLQLPAAARLALFLASYLLSGGDVLLVAARNLLRGKVFDENFLMGIATIGAFAIGEYPEAVAVMLFYQVGELFQEMAVNRSRKSISALMDIRPDAANLKTDCGVTVVSPWDVHPGDTIIVKPGERVPLDGRVVEGRSALDTSALTGESLPREVEPGDTVLSGSINKSGLLTVEVMKEFGESTVSKILEMVQNASSRKAPAESFITKLARWYTPAVVFAAVALAVLPPLIMGLAFSEWLHRALIFLVVSCPCALVISIPLSFFGGIGGASRRGILVKGGNYLDALNRVDTVVFDKTGTLTRGIFKVSQVNTAGGFTTEALLETAALAESWSSHPIAASILVAYGREPDRSRVGHYEEIPGFGVRAVIDGSNVLAGNEKLMQRENITCVGLCEGGTAMYIAVDGIYSGSIVITDEVKPDAQEAIRGLRKMGVKKLVMLTGDSRAAGEHVGRLLGLDEVHAGMLPAQKVEKLEQLQKQSKGKVLFVGDGINDAPVLARADVGVAMGALGSDAAIEAADVVIMTDEPSKLVDALGISRRTRAIVWQNIVFALGVKGLFLILGAFGIATLWEAVFADVGVALIAVLNAMRVMRNR